MLMMEQTTLSKIYLWYVGTKREHIAIALRTVLQYVFCSKATMHAMEKNKS